MRRLAFLWIPSLALIVAGLLLYLSFTLPGPLAQAKRVVIPERSRLPDIARLLSAEGVIDYPRLFCLETWLQGTAHHFQSGEYRIPAHATPQEVARLLVSGKTVIHRLTMPEGFTSTEALALLAHTGSLSGDLPDNALEGALLPETYYYSYHDARRKILARMEAGMRKTLSALWPNRAPHLPLTTPEEALTLASIIERETDRPEERPHIAAVYFNRLKRGMPLQADPTVLYAITKGRYRLDHPLTARELATPSPYNTYLAPGLPPGPIANPGRASLIAALHPEASEDLYFVATGAGGHRFARTREEHVLNVKRYRATLHSARPSHP